MDSYKYKQPKGTKYTIPMKQWNKVFAKRGRAYLTKVEVYVDEEEGVITTQYVNSVLGKVVLTLAIPFLLLYGMWTGGIKDLLEALLAEYFQKSRGTFSSDVTYNQQGEGWKKIMEMIGK